MSINPLVDIDGGTGRIEALLHRALVDWTPRPTDVNPLMSTDMLCADINALT